MKTITEQVEPFIEVLGNDPNCRNRSWEHFHSKFESAVQTGSHNVDDLTLNMFAYLASWGMLRGSTFSIHKDYLFHGPVVEILLDEKYHCLLNLSLDKIDENKIRLILDLKKDIINCYIGKTYYDIYGNKHTIRNVTDTLIGKILMGSFGCSVCYDEYGRAALKSKGFQTALNSKSLIELKKFYIDNKPEFDKLAKESNVYEVEYPAMKVLDMYFWELGIELKAESN